MGRFFSHECYLRVTHLYGLKGYGENTKLVLFLYPDKLSFHQQKDMPLTQVIDVEYFDNIEMVEVGNNPVGKAILGGILFGGVGAVVGAAAGSGKSKVQKELRYLRIKYKDYFGEHEMLFCVSIVDKSNAQKFAEKLKRKMKVTLKK